MLLFKNIILVISALVLAFIVSEFGFPFYEGYFSIDGFFSVYSAAALLIFVFVNAFVFFVTLLFSSFIGGKYKYWWIGILLIPAVAFEVYFDLEHIYFPIVLGFLGWAIGYLIQKFVAKSQSGK